MFTNKLSDFQQSNIGISSENQISMAGKARIQGSKVFLYFEGDYNQFHEQIRQVITEVILNNIMYGGDVKERIRSEVFITLPVWYSQGLISYMTNPNEIGINNKIRDGFMLGSYDKFNKVMGDRQIELGHSFWAYISQVYGDKVIANILYMTHLSRNIESGFQYVLGISLRNLYIEYLAYNSAVYEGMEENGNGEFGDPLIKRPKTDYSYYQARISPDGEKLIYASNIMGQYKVWMKDLSTSKRPKKVLRVDHKLDRIADESYPLLAWHPTGSLFTMITERKGSIWISHYKLDEKKFSKREVFKFEKVLSMDYSEDGRKLVFSAVMKGQSDIFVYTLASTEIKRVTNDVYDDLTPKFMEGRTKIVFSSNRTSDTIQFDDRQKMDPQFDKLDLFVYDNEHSDPVLTRLTYSKDWNETEPDLYNKEYMTFLSDKRGQYERYIIKLDSSISHVDTLVHYKHFSKSYRITDFNRSIQEHDYSPQNGKYVQVVYENGRNRIFKGEIVNVDAAILEEEESIMIGTPAKAIEFTSDSLMKIFKEDKESVIEGYEEEEKETEHEVNIDNYIFDFEDNETLEPDALVDIDMDSAMADTVVRKFVLPPKRAYKTIFTNDFFSMRALDNSIVSFSYQSTVSQPLTNTILQVGMSDLFEDYRIVGGLNTELSLLSNSDNESFLVFKDVKKRMDKTLGFLRQSINPSQIPSEHSYTNSRFNQIQYTLKWPFSEVFSMRFGVTAIYINEIEMVKDRAGLETPDKRSYFTGGNIDFVFDNTLIKGVNIFYGTRAKWGLQVFQELKDPKETMLKVSLDYRHYQKIHREFILATRFHAKSSFGSMKELFRLGAVDNWMSQFQNTNENFTALENTQNYRFQSYATSVRGFRRDVRKGNTYAIVTNELRLPFFKYIATSPIRSEFIANFQIIGFFDVGSAWVGVWPDSDVNQSNSKPICDREGDCIDDFNVKITLKNYSEPIIYGYGFGFRSVLSNYFIRADWGWGVEDGVLQDKIFYFSVGLDF